MFSYLLFLRCTFFSLTEWQLCSNCTITFVQLYNSNSNVRYFEKIGRTSFNSTILSSRIDFTKCRDIVEDALQTYCKRWSKKEGVGVHALNDWKNEFLRVIDIRIDNFTKHPHLYKQPPSRSAKSLKRKNGEITPYVCLCSCR